ncbi:restriction endonuclease subunit S [Mesorhizobium sp. ES1-4]|nr:restriction endonuclease subunit S [Mesorhizobium sp. ES1-4]
MIDWPMVKLGDVADFLTGFPFKSASYSDAVSDPRLLRGDNIAQGTLRWDNAKRWPLTLTDDVSPYRLEQRDVVLAMDRPWIDAGLKYATVRSDDLPSFLVQRVARLRGTQYLSTRFLRYVLGSRAFTDYVLGVQTGTAVPHISGGQIKAYQFRLPSIPEQEQIAEILGSLDDKIDLNRRMNEALEAMAQAIFRDWFVDFGPTRRKMDGATDPVEIVGGLVTDPERAQQLSDMFPAVTTDNAVPEGWKAVAISNLIEFNPSEPLKRGTIAPYSDMSSLPTRGSLAEPPIEREFGSGMRFRNGDALLARITPCLENGKAAFVDFLASPSVVGWGSTEFIVLRAKPPVPPPYAYLLVRHDEFRDRAIRSMTGTSGRQRAQPDSLASFMCADPSKEVLEAFGKIITPWFSMISANGGQNRTLAAARDLLLPKLMSGEIRLNEAERQLEAAQ